MGVKLEVVGEEEEEEMGIGGRISFDLRKSSEPGDYASAAPTGWLTLAHYSRLPQALNPPKPCRAHRVGVHAARAGRTMLQALHCQLLTRDGCADG